MGDRDDGNPSELDPGRLGITRRLSVAKKVLISFADSRLEQARERFVKQAEAMNFFSDIMIFDETNVIYPFPQRVQSQLVPEVRGFGYWVWKPAVILQALAALDEGDLVLYADIGCHFNTRATERLATYFLTLDEDDKGIVCFQAKPPNGPLVWDGRFLPNFVDAAWTKGDLLDFFGVRSRLDIVETGTIGAGVILLKKCGFVESLINKWLATMVNNWNLVDDSESTTANHPWFVENRHDQSVFSILAKLENLTTLSAFEYWYPERGCPHLPDWDALAEFPIHARRDKLPVRKSTVRRWITDHKRGVSLAWEAYSRSLRH